MRLSPLSPAMFPKATPKFQGAKEVFDHHAQLAKQTPHPSSPLFDPLEKPMLAKQIPLAIAGSQVADALDQLATKVMREPMNLKQDIANAISIQALALNEAVFGTNHLQTIAALSRLADIAASDNAVVSEVLSELATRLADRPDALSPPSLSERLLEEVITLLEGGKYVHDQSDNAVILIDIAVALAESQVGTNAMNTLNTPRVLIRQETAYDVLLGAGSYLADKHYLDEAEPYLERALDTFLAANRNKHTRMTTLFPQNQPSDAERINGYLRRIYQSRYKPGVRALKEQALRPKIELMRTFIKNDDGKTLIPPAV